MRNQILTRTERCPSVGAPLLLLVALPVFPEGLIPSSIAAVPVAGAAADPDEPVCEIA